MLIGLGRQLRTGAARLAAMLPGSSIQFGPPRSSTTTASIKDARALSAIRSSGPDPQRVRSPRSPILRWLNGCRGPATLPSRKSTWPKFRKAATGAVFTATSSTAPTRCSPIFPPPSRPQASGTTRSISSSFRRSANCAARSRSSTPSSRIIIITGCSTRCPVSNGYAARVGIGTSSTTSFFPGSSGLITCKPSSVSASIRPR